MAKAPSKVAKLAGTYTRVDGAWLTFTYLGAGKLAFEGRNTNPAVGHPSAPKGQVAIKKGKGEVHYPLVSGGMRFAFQQNGELKIDEKSPWPLLSFTGTFTKTP